MYLIYHFSIMIIILLNLEWFLILVEQNSVLLGMENSIFYNQVFINFFIDNSMVIGHVCIVVVLNLF